MPQITKKHVASLHNDGRTRRIDFSNQHKDALKKSPYPFIGTFNIPFDDGFSKLFTICPLFINKNDISKNKGHSCWHSIKTESLYTDIENWIELHKDVVFLRDTLCVSIALSAYVNHEQNIKTCIGKAVDRAKSQNCDDAINFLVEELVNKIEVFDIYNNSDFICAVPSDTMGSDLPKILAEKVSERLNKTDITNMLQFKNSKSKSVKDVSFNEKWNIWEKSNLEFNGKLNEKSILLIDDKYQSGTTIQFVAMKLEEAGAHQVYGLCCVKTSNDDDNITK